MRNSKRLVCTPANPCLLVSNGKRRKIMLDYSDEELESHFVRRRNHSPSGGIKKFSEDRRIQKRQSELSKKVETSSTAAFESKTQSIFKSLKERSSKLIMPASHLSRNSAFIINDFVSNKISSKSQNFHLTLTDEVSSDKEDHPDSFFKSMRTIVFLAQFFAVMPVSGTFGPNYKSIHFKWVHYKTLYWSFAFSGVFFCFVCSTIHGLNKGTLTQAASGITYFACGVFSSLLMLNLGQNWKKINKDFAEMEFKLKKFGYPKKIGLKFKIFSISVLLVALVEHLLGKLKNIELASVCGKNEKNFFSLTEFFFRNEYPEVFDFRIYSLWIAILVFVAHFLTTANWNIKDLFLCLISWSIAERFKQIHDLLDQVHGKEKSVDFWKEVREDYNTLSVLTKKLDFYIQKLMLLSIGNNLFFICIQLFHSLKRIASVKLIYFFWSFGFLVLRTSFVAFSAARINDESKEPKTVLYSVPQKNYTAEVRRFLTQLTTNDVALTGSGFFSVTRSLILTIIGTVITYEIVLVQFSGNEAEEDVKYNQTVCVHY